MIELCFEVGQAGRRQRDEAIGVKMVTVFPENQQRFPHLPSIQGVYVLFDGRNGKNACFQFAAVHPLSEHSAAMASEKDRRIHGSFHCK